MAVVSAYVLLLATVWAAAKAMKLEFVLQLIQQENLKLA